MQNFIFSSWIAKRKFLLVKLYFTINEKKKNVKSSKMAYLSVEDIK